MKKPFYVPIKRGTNKDVLAEVKKYYLASMPIALDLPRVSKETFVVHKTINRTSGWTVTHYATGRAIARGYTKIDAMAAAQQVLLKAGEDKFFACILMCDVINILNNHAE